MLESHTLISLSIAMSLIALIPFLFNGLSFWRTTLPKNFLDHMALALYIFSEKEKYRCIILQRPEIRTGRQ
jgi:hypothetical protein